jgi:PAS domain S-box-containing protein
MQGEANAALVRMLGCESLKELVAWNASEPQMLRQLDEFMETVRQQGTVRGLQYRVTTRDGKAIVTSVSAQAERDERGDLKRISGTVEDVTVRVQAEAALRESEERYRTLVEGLNTGVFRFFPVSRRLECNTALARMHGFRSADELLAWARTNPQMWEQGERVMEAVREKGYVTNLEVARQTVDGTSITIAISAKAEYDERGQIRSVAGTVEDVTERERAQQDLLSYQERLRSLALQLLSAEERERRRMAAVLHDELGQTLAMAAMKAGALKRSASARRLTAGLDEVVALIQQALQASRSLTTELSPPMLHELGLEPALQWLADQWRENHGLAVTVETDGASSPLREETAAVLFRSVRELLVNVVKHARASRAGVLIQGGDGEVRVTVEDDGVGFDASEGGLQGSRTGAFGLFSIREQLSHFGGRLEVKTERGHGTAVRLTVPLDPDGPAGKEDGE